MSVLLTIGENCHSLSAEAGGWALDEQSWPAGATYDSSNESQEKLIERLVAHKGAQLQRADLGKL